jgi:hypothetical protein
MRTIRRYFVGFTLATMIALAGASATAQESRTNPRIVGGTRADSDSNPFQVALLDKYRAGGNYYKFFCGGTLYKQIYVVTAAHCSEFLTPERVWVLTNTRKLDGSGVRRSVVKITIHPDWNRNSMVNDVAVWKLASPGPYFPVLLADHDPPSGPSSSPQAGAPPDMGHALTPRRCKKSQFPAHPGANARVTTKVPGTASRTPCCAPATTRVVKTPAKAIRVDRLRATARAPRSTSMC